MAEKEMISVRLPTDTKERVERYAEEHDISQSDALRRLLEKGADLEEAGLAVAASTRNPSEDEPVPDGGYLRLSDHPWIDPIIRVGEYTSIFSVLVTVAAVLSIIVLPVLADWFGAVGIVAWVGAFYGLAILGAIMLGISVIAILVLEYLMHPSEAPIRRYFNDHNGEAEVITS